MKDNKTNYTAKRINNYIDMLNIASTYFHINPIDIGYKEIINGEDKCCKEEKNKSNLL